MRMVIFFIVIIGNIYSQIRMFEKIDTIHDEYVISKLSFTENNVRRIIDSIKYFKGMSNRDDFKTYLINKDEKGNMHLKSKFLRNNYEVYGSKVIIHVNKDEKIYLMNGKIINKFKGGDNFNVTLQDAKNKAILYLLDHESINENEISIKVDTLYYPNKSNFHELSYKFLITIKNDVFYIVIVSAITGNIIDVYQPIDICVVPNFNNINQNSHFFEKNILLKKNTSGLSVSGCSGECIHGSGNTLYYGAQNIYIGRYKFGLDCKYRLIKKCGDTYLHTLSKTFVSSNSTSSDGYEYTDQNSTFSFNATTPGVSLHFGLNECVRYFWDHFGRKGFEQSYGTTIKGYCNNNLYGSYNAFYSKVDKSLNFGNGENCNYCYNDILALDIIGHEYTHGISHYEVDFYYYGEPASINEGFSDIFGNMIEYYTKSIITTGTAFDYFIGNECFSFTQLTIPSTTISYYPVRNISNPKSTLNPDTYNGVYFIPPSMTNIDNGGSHINSTILSYAFYLLAEGGQGINDLGNSYCVHGIGKQKAWKIAYHALENYLSTYSTFNDTRNAFVQSAIDLFGNGLESAECEAAWFAVGVGGPPSVPFIPISNKTESGLANYHYNNSISIFSYTTLPSSTIDISSNQSIHVTESHFSQGSEVHLYIAPACAGGAKYANSNNSKNYNKQEYTYTLPSFSINSSNNNHLYTLFPNPTSSLVHLQLPIHIKNSYTLKITNLLGQPLSLPIQKLSDTMISIDFSDIPEGVYIVHYTDSEGNLFTNKVVVKR